MRIAHLTPGTGHFHCGSCLRDHALVQALRRRGHDATMVPLYLPFVLDEESGRPSGEGEEVQLGGVNLYLAHRAPWTRRLPRLLHRLLDRPGFLRWSSRRGDMTDASGLGPMTLATLEGDDGGLSRELEGFASWMEHSARPDVLVLSNLMLLGMARPLRRHLGVPVVVTLQGEQPFLDSLPEPWRSRSWQALRDQVDEVAHFAAVSRWYGELVAERLGLGPERWSVVHNGIELEAELPEVRARADAEVPTLGYLARLCTDKGLSTLVDAWIELRRRDTVPGLKLLALGAQVKADRPLMKDVLRRIARAGLGADAEFLANVDLETKRAALRRMHVMSVPATYGESFGLYLLEAWSYGIPVVQPRHAAFPELIEATGGGRLCEPDDPASLADALEELLGDEPARQDLARRGQTAVRERFVSDSMAVGMEAVCTMATSVPT